MTVADDLTVAIRLACLIEDRGDAEQRALLRTARRIDNELNKNVDGNKRMWGDRAGSTEAVRQLPASDLEGEVHRSRVLSDWPGDGEHPVALPARKRKPGE